MSVIKNGRHYLPTFAQLCDRLSIVTLKSIKIHENKEEYEQEAKLIMKDISLSFNTFKLNYKEMGYLLRAIQVNAVTNEMIWNNESKARQGSKEQDKLLKLTHSLNRIRNQAMNVISHIIGERKDLKLDYMDEELTKKFGYDFEGVLNE